MDRYISYAKWTAGVLMGMFLFSRFSEVNHIDPGHLALAIFLIVAAHFTGHDIGHRDGLLLGEVREAQRAELRQREAVSLAEGRARTYEELYRHLKAKHEPDQL